MNATRRFTYELFDDDWPAFPADVVVVGVGIGADAYFFELIVLSSLSNTLTTGHVHQFSLPVDDRETLILE